MGWEKLLAVNKPATSVRANGHKLAMDVGGLSGSQQFLDHVRETQPLGQILALKLHEPSRLGEYLERQKTKA